MPVEAFRGQLGNKPRHYLHLPASTTYAESVLKEGDLGLYRRGLLETVDKPSDMKLILLDNLLILTTNYIGYTGTPFGSYKSLIEFVLGRLKLI